MTLNLYSIVCSLEFLEVLGKSGRRFHDGLAAPAANNLERDEVSTD